MKQRMTEGRAGTKKGCAERGVCEEREGGERVRELNLCVPRTGALYLRTYRGALMTAIARPGRAAHLTFCLVPWIG